MHCPQPGVRPLRQLAAAVGFAASGRPGVRQPHGSVPLEPPPSATRPAVARPAPPARRPRFVLRTLLDCFGYERVIVLEDDMELAPDLFSYFEVPAARWGGARRRCWGG